MRSKRLLERAITLFVVFVVAFSAIASIPASAQVPSGDGGNPVVEDAAAVPAAAKMDLRDLRKIDPAQPVRLLVVLKDAPLATYDGSVRGLAATTPSATGARKLNVDAVASRAYLSYLNGKQEQFKADLSAIVPDARYDRSYQVVLNGFGIKVMGSDVAKILEMPEVAYVQTDNEYKLEMDASIPLIGLGTGTLGDPGWVDAGLWTAVGGHANAGKGIKVADIDSGITPENPCFDGAGYSYPKGFPKGEKAITNKKIIAAYSYFRADDPPVNPESARDDPAINDGGHGTHTAGTIACNYGTVSTFSNLKISGVAPKAQLMVYRVFYESITGSHSAYTVELVAAIEQAVKDGADVANNSWGGTALAMDEVETMAYQAAVDAGVIVVFSAGNSGPAAMTHGSPSIGEKFISVAASQTNRTFTTTLSVDSSTDPGAVLPAVMTGASVAQQTVTAEIIDLQAEAYPDTIACSGPLPGSLVAGKIVVVQRGTCALVDKVMYAAMGGAVGVVIRNVAGGATTLPIITPVLPTIHIAQADGDPLYTFLNGLAVGTTATATIQAAALNLAGDTPDVLASFSSRGPAPDLSLKPDISAPGVNILSSVSPVEFGGSTNFDFYQGTSMAAPHVSGAAALLAQLKPTWTPQQVKSALMSTAVEPAALGTNPANRGAGRLSLVEPHLVGATASPASVSLKLMTIGDEKPVTIGLQSTGAAVTYDVTAELTTSQVGIIDLPPTVTVPAGGFEQLEFTAEALSAGDGYGKIVLTPQGGGPVLHFPYFGRVVAELGTGDEEIFLIDDDLSVDDPSCNDALPAYIDMLEDLGKTYVVWEVGYDNGYAIDFNQARKYDKVVYFTGACDFNSDLSFLGNSMRNYLAQGGKMLITGQDIGYWDNVWLNTYGASFNPALFFGGRYIQDDIFPGDQPVPAAKGDSTYSTYLDGQMYDIDPSINPWVDEIQAVMYSDVDTLPILHAAPVGSILRDGHLGTRMSDEMTIERMKGSEPYTRVGYRTEWVSFGLEAVTDNFNSGTELMDRLLAWLDDEVSVEFDEAHFFGKNGGFATTLTATADFDYAGGTVTGFENSILQYRWDFGDGSDVVVTADPLVRHKYAKLGDYKVLVEVVDGFGHKAVNEAMVHIVKSPAAPKTLPPSGLKTATPTLRWSVVKGATDYQIEIWSMANNRTIHQLFVDDTACVKNVCSLVSPALANGVYKFKVRAYMGPVFGNFSAYRQFKVAAP